MKQVLLGDHVVVVEVPTPGLAARQVLVEVAYSFISTGTEVAGVKSASKSVLARIKEHPKRVLQVLEMVRINGVKRTLARVRDRLDSRMPLGYSCSGRVVAVGSEVTRFAIGDLVACAGAGYASHAEVVAVPVNLVTKLPEDCDLRAAAGTTIASVALQGVRRADLRLGETAAVMGLGLLGQITLQLLAANGVNAIGFDPDPQRLEEAKALGFDKCFAMTGEQAASQVQALTGEMGADATIITAATNAEGICQDAMEMTRRKGKVVVVGAVPLTFDRDPFYRKEIDFLISCSYGPGRYDPSYEQNGQDYPYGYVRWTENRNMQAVLQLMADGKLRMDPLISAEYPAGEATQAFASLAGEASSRPLGVVLNYNLQSQTPAGKLATSVSVAPPKPLAGKIGLGVIGVGNFFRGMHLPNIGILSNRYQIVAICDHNTSGAQDVARRVGAVLACSDANELLACEDVQVVMITTRHNTHALLATAALRADKHVFVEKPMAMDDAELAELREVIAESERYFMVGFNRRFSPHAARLRRLLEERVSPLVVNYRVFADPVPRDHWVYSPAGGRRVIGEACHMFDLFDFLVGDDIGIAEIDVIAPPGEVGGPPGDNFVASIRYEDGSLCTLTYSALGRRSKTNGKERVEAMWDGKTFIIDDFLRSSGAGCSAGSAANKKGKGHYEELVALADYLADKGPVPITVNACVRATTTSFRVDAACRGVSSD